MTEPLRDDRLAQRARLALDVPLVAALGVRLIAGDDPPAGVTFTVASLAGNGIGGLHAAALGAALEVAAYLALLPHLTAAEHAVTHAAATQLVGAAAAGEAVAVRGTSVARTGRLGFVSVTARTGDRLVACAQLTKSIVRMP